MSDVRTSRSFSCLLFLAALFLWTGTATAQDGVVRGQVVAGDDGQPLSGATVQLRGTDLGVLVEDDGSFRIGGVAAGSYTVEASMLGYRTASRRVELGPGQQVEITFRLAARPLEVQGIDVSVLRPDLQPQAELKEREVREANPKDSGELLRELPGLSAVRRGPLGLDPSVRGLRETEVGTYLDGTRMFPAGPARMDSPLTHLDPSAISDIQVVKGPYALTWGAGNLSAVRVETRSLPEREGVGGRLSAGYDANLGAAETTGSVAGRSGKIGYWAMGAWRQGDDYETADGTSVPGDYRSAEGRVKLGIETGDDSDLIFSGGYQDQGPIDYPGRLLRAKLFHTWNFSGRWQLERGDGLLRSFEAMAYVNDVEHEMDNSGKPTALPDPGRMPPFALDVAVDAGVNVKGGRLDAVLSPNDRWEVEVGGDVYSANRNAVRTIRRAQDDMLLFEDLMWPDATITDAGLFARTTRRLGSRVRATGTVRLDLVEATADSVSDFFRANTTGDLEQSEAHLSGALTLGVDVSEHWTLSGGVGSAVRTADATERYSDRIPATKAQTSAEFMGNPTLEPERSNQADLWIEGSYEDLALQLNVFGRKLENYITLEATGLPKRLPLSPPTVFRYINGEATFWGYEASATVGLSDAVTLDAGTSYLWGHDDTVDEPALGVHPLKGSLGLRYEHPGGRFFAESTVEAVGDMDRQDVALTRNEGPTDGYVLVELRGGVQIYRGLNLRVGVDNLTDRQYTNHLNARNPFTGQQVPEPGRVIFADLSYEF